MLTFITANPAFSISVVLLALVALVLVAVFVRDVFIQRSHAIQHNFPVVGHLRYFFESIGPELRQYWVAHDKEELPFNRSERAWVYASAKAENNTFGFGTSEQIYATGYPIIKHAVFPFPETDVTVLEGDPSLIPCLKVIGARRNRKRPYRPMSIVNISAMSFGSLGARAVEALNRGAKGAHAYHNTGEGGVSPYHLKGGGDIVWQLGTGYFGARDEHGNFSMDVLVQTVRDNPQIRMIEVKLSQGAKPGKGGILPGAKVTAEIAAIRKVPVGKDCYSPNFHQMFGSVDEMIDFIEAIAEASGLPVGIKSAVGKLEFFEELAIRMRERNQGPDYIAIDGGEGGTGAAPLTFSDHVSLPFKIGFARVYQVFQNEGMASEVVWIGAGKLGFPDRAVIAIAMGCDLIYVAREAMMSIGCIQAQKCHTGHCPAGVATQEAWLEAGLDVPLKAERAKRYLKSFRKELLSLAWAAGYEHPGLFRPEDVEFSTGVNRFTPLNEVMGYSRDPAPYTSFADLTAEG
ncbi:MAG: FMN-binding glutamate synthase family protein [Myxococcota bacterium]